MELRPIRDIDYENAVAIADQLAVLNKRTRDQDDYLETLGELIASMIINITHRNWIIVQSLKYLLEQNDINLSQLGEILGEPFSLIQQLLSEEQELRYTAFQGEARSLF